VLPPLPSLDTSPGRRVFPRPPLWVVLYLLALGGVLFTTRVDGPFLVDECHYLVQVSGLRQCSLSVPGTEGLTPTPALAYFDPMVHFKKHHTSPVVSTVPPLYAVMALPFSLLGWPGLVLLNLLSFLMAGYLVWAHTASLATRPHTPGLALVTFTLGTYCLEYAQGMWPQMLSMFLCTLSVVLAARVRDGASMGVALAAGIMGGLASGVRYQNIVVAGMVGLGLLALGQRRRTEASAMFILGLSLPLGASSVFNYLRLGHWNPLSKGASYLKFLTRRHALRDLREPLAVLWAKVVDFTTYPPYGFLGSVRQPITQGYLLNKALKKALTQSSPWIPSALAGLVLAVHPHTAASFTPRQVRELRAMGLVVAGIMGVFALAGFARTDGFCFNQRYFIEMLPLLAVTLALLAERVRMRPEVVLRGALGTGAALTALYLLLPATSVLRQVVLLKGSILLGLVLLSLFLASNKRRLRVHAALLLLLGASLAWSLVVHLGDDVAAADVIRHRRGWLKDQMAEVIRGMGPVAVVAHLPSAINLCPLHLHHDIVVVNASLDGAKHTPALVSEWLRQGRRVLLSVDRYFPSRLIKRAADGRMKRTLLMRRGYRVVEIYPRKGEWPTSAGSPPPPPHHGRKAP